MKVFNIRNQAYGFFNEVAQFKKHIKTHFTMRSSNIPKINSSKKCTSPPSYLPPLIMSHNKTNGGLVGRPLGSISASLPAVHTKQEHIIWKILVPKRKERTPDVGIATNIIIFAIISWSNKQEEVIKISIYLGSRLLGNLLRLGDNLVDPSNHVK